MIAPRSQLQGTGREGPWERGCCRRDDFHSSLVPKICLPDSVWVAVILNKDMVTSSFWQRSWRIGNSSDDSINDTCSELECIHASIVSIKSNQEKGFDFWVLQMFPLKKHNRNFNFGFTVNY